MEHSARRQGMPRSSLKTARSFAGNLLSYVLISMLDLNGTADPIEDDVAASRPPGTGGVSGTSFQGRRGATARIPATRASLR